MTNDRIRRQIQTPIFRVSYPHLDKPSKSKKYPESPEKYSIKMIFGEDTLDLDRKYGTATKLEDMAALIQEITGLRHKGKTAAQLLEAGTLWRIPLKKNEEGKFEMTASNRNKIQCLDAAKNVLDTADRAVCYGGMYARAIVTFCDYQDGIACYLDAFQKVEDGEPFGGTGLDAVSAFDDLSAEPAKPVGSLEGLL